MDMDARRILRHLSRLRREGAALLRDRPLDELAHAKWFQRVERYLQRAFPESRLRRSDELVDFRPPDLLDPDLKPLHPLDAELARADGGCRLIRRQLTVLASRAEQLELKMEQGRT